MKPTTIIAALSLGVLTIAPGKAGEFEEETSRLISQLENPSVADPANPFGHPAKNPRAIVERLAEIGPEARAAVPLLTKYLQSGRLDWDVGYALSQIGADAIPHVLPAVEHEDPNVRSSAYHILATIGPDANFAAPALIARLDEPDPDLRRRVVETLGDIEPPLNVLIPALMKALNDEVTTSTAAYVLGDLGPRAAEAVPELVRLSSTAKSGQVRKAALQALVRIDNTCMHSAPALAKALRDHERADDYWGFSVSSEAGRLLEQMGPHSSSALHLILEALKDDQVWTERHQFVVESSLTSLGNCGESAEDAVPILRSVMRNDRFKGKLSDDSATRIRATAAGALLRILPDEMEARERLLTILRDPKWKRPGKPVPIQGGGTYFPDPRPTAAKVLGRSRTRQEDELTILRKLVEEGIERKHESLAYLSALAAIELSPGDPTFLDVLMSDPRRANVSPAEFAKWIGDRSEELFPVLMRRFLWIGSPVDPDNAFYRDVLMAINADHLQRMVHESKLRLNGKANGRGESNLYTRKDAFELLAVLGERSDSVVPILIEALGDEEPELRAGAAATLGRLKLNTNVALPALRKALDDPRAIVRARAAGALGNFGAAAVDHVEAILTATQDDYLVVRNAAKTALQKVEPAK